MAEFEFDQLEQFVPSTGKMDFLKLVDNGCYATLRFMYGPGETFKGYSCHDIRDANNRSTFISCFRELGQPVDACPLCQKGIPLVGQYFIPVYVISISECINGVMQPEKQVNKPMLLQKGKTFQGALASVVRQSAGTPFVNNVFRLVRSGKKGDMRTTYQVEFVSRDNVSLQDLPERLDARGTFMLPNLTKEEVIAKYCMESQNSIQPRQISASTFGNAY